MKATGWGICEKGGLWTCAFYRRRDAMQWAVERGIGAHEYQVAGTLSNRWKIARRRGIRVVRVEVRATGDV